MDNFNIIKKFVIGIVEQHNDDHSTTIDKLKEFGFILSDILELNNSTIKYDSFILKYNTIEYYYIQLTNPLNLYGKFYSYFVIINTTDINEFAKKIRLNKINNLRKINE